MRILRIPLILLALAGLIALAGCGDDEESTSTETSEALTAEEYTEQARTVLEGFATQFSTLGAQIQQSGTAEEFGSLVDQAEAEIQGTIEEFGALQPPEEAQEGHDQILSALEDFSSKLTDVSDAAASGDKAALQETAQQLQAAVLDFQEQVAQAVQSLSEAGIELQGTAPVTTGG